MLGGGRLMVMWGARILLGLVVLGWSRVLFKLLVSWRTSRWKLQVDGLAKTPDVSISVVIPARNEGHNIDGCLHSVRTQNHPCLQIVVFDDGSQDSTADIVAEHARADQRVLSLSGGDGVAEGWFGKPWALKRASAHANGQWLVFIDADVRLVHPDALDSVVSYAITNEVDMVTGIGDMVMESFWERVLQPAVGGLILAGNDLDWVNDPNKADSNLANGQFIAISRETYHEIGGHEAVKDDILDDIGLARAVVNTGFTYRCLWLNEVFSCRMYTGLSDLWEGWTKNLFAGLRYSWLNLSVAVFGTFLFSVLGPILVILGVFGVVANELWMWGVAIAVLLHAVRLLMDIRHRNTVWYGLTHAPASLLVMMMMMHSGVRTVRGAVTWKGRKYRPGQQK